MRLISLGVGVVVVAMLAACASSDKPSPAATVGASDSSTVASPSTSSSGPTAAQNKAAAQAEAGRLVSAAILPPGAVRESVQPVGLTGPAMGLPGTTQLIDTVAFFRVPLSLTRAHAWFVAHPQQGLTLGGTASGSGRSGPTSYGFGYDSPSPASWGSASLDIGLASAGPAATGVRVDAVAQWVDPSPTRDASRGRAIRVTISEGCPRSDRGWDDVSNPGAPDLNRQLLPAATPTAGLRCTYDGLNGRAFTLIDNQRLDATQAGSAAELIRALPLSSRGLLPHGCPMSDGRATILVLGYAGRADVDIWQNMSGCASTKNGHVVSGDN